MTDKTNMNILGLIPARGGSKGIPRKNIKLLEGKELIRYSIEIGLDCPEITQLIVSTDDAKIAKISQSAGADVPFIRPANLASDQSPTIDTVIHAIAFFKQKNIHFDAVCLLQATTPFRNPKDVSQAIQKFVKHGADSLISVREVPHTYNPHWVFEEEKESGFLKIATGEKSIISRRQDLPKTYYRDGSIYITKTEILMKQNSLYGNKIIHHEMAASSAINIDNMEDWAAAEAYMKQSKSEK